jgi:hypothetical protein
MGAAHRRAEIPLNVAAILRRELGDFRPVADYLCVERGQAAELCRNAADWTASPDHRILKLSANSHMRGIPTVPVLSPRATML